jgi:hypothetical protein
MKSRFFLFQALCGVVLALGLAACDGTVDLAARRADYDAVLGVPARARTALAAKTALFKRLLARGGSPAAAPYPALRACLRTMAGEADALESVQSSAAAFEGDFDFFAATHATVSPQQPEAWDAFESLDGRFPPMDRAILAHQRAFNAAAARFDALAMPAGAGH